MKNSAEYKIRSIYPAFELITKEIFTEVISFLFFLQLLVSWLTIIDFPHRCDKSCTAASLSLITIWVAEILMVADEVWSVG